MKKVFLLLCFLGIAFPYYYLFKYLELNNWEWSLSQFFAEANSNFAASMLSADLSVAAISFFIFIIYSFYNNPVKIIKYMACFFLVGFSLALPFYFYDNFDKLKKLNHIKKN